jgi:hypothetical protein
MPPVSATPPRTIAATELRVRLPPTVVAFPTLAIASEEKPAIAARAPAMANDLIFVRDAWTPDRNAAVGSLPNA